MTDQNQFFKPIIIKAIGGALATIIGTYIVFQLDFKHPQMNLSTNTGQDTSVVDEPHQEPIIDTSEMDPTIIEIGLDKDETGEGRSNQQFIQKELQTKGLLGSLESAYNYLKTGHMSDNRNIAFEHFIKVTQALSPEAIAMLEKSSPLLEESRHCIDKNDSTCALRKFIKIYQPYRPQHSIY